MSEKKFLTADNTVEHIDSGIIEENGCRYEAPSGMNFLFRSAFLRMTLVATSTVVAVSSIAFLTIGTCELSYNENKDQRNDALVLVAGGIILLIASFFQFLTIGLWSGWCYFWPASRLYAYDKEIQVQQPNQLLINGQMINVKRNPGVSCTSSTITADNALISSSGFDLLEPSLQVIPEEGEAFPQFKAFSKSEMVPMLEIVSNDGSKVDATTSTRGEIVYFPTRAYAPLALQEDITPSLRSSFQSFDELA